MDTDDNTAPPGERQLPGPPDAAVYVIEDLAQLKALADPLRVRILEALCEVPRTTKQVAEALGEKPTKLYHHVEALDRVGLIELHSTRPNRGTLEKYFRAVARSFRADASLFSTGEQSSEVAAIGADLLLRSAEELRALDMDALGGAEPMVVQLRATVGPERIQRLQGEIQALVDRLVEEDDDAGQGSEEETVTYQLVLALYPADGSDR